MLRFRSLLLLLAATTSAFGACTVSDLSPQPDPPSVDGPDASDDGMPDSGDGAASGGTSSGAGGAAPIGGAGGAGGWGGATSDEAP